MPTARGSAPAASDGTAGAWSSREVLRWVGLAHRPGPGRRWKFRVGWRCSMRRLFHIFSRLNVGGIFFGHGGDRKRRPGGGGEVFLLFGLDVGLSEIYLQVSIGSRAALFCLHYVLL